jgi:hypothetical protein
MSSAFELDESNDRSQPLRFTKCVPVHLDKMNHFGSQERLTRIILLHGGCLELYSPGI